MISYPRHPKKMLLLRSAGFRFIPSAVKQFPSLSAGLFFLLTALIVLPRASFSQIDTTHMIEQKQDDLLEQITENGEDQNLDYDNIIDLEHSLSRHPINLNKAIKEDFRPLIDLKLLNDIQINSLLQYRAELGNFITIYELQAVPYMDLNTIQIILPYVFVSENAGGVKTTLVELLTSGDYLILIRGTQILEEQKGFSPADSSSTSRYLGSRLNLYTRYRYTYGSRFSYGITGQKDAGEEFFKGSQQEGFDFYSVHLYYSGKNFLKAIVLGDYELNLGQGMIVGSGFGVNKSSLITAIKNGGRTIRPYTSTDEFNFFRGGALQFGTRHLQATLFGSYKKIDGNVGAVDTLGDNVFVTSYGGNGYHRTISELGNKRTISQNISGANLDYSIAGFNAGGTFFHTDFSSPVEPSFQSYNTFSFRGDQLNDYGVHFDWQYKNFNFYGEGVKSEPGGLGGVTGLLISVDPKVDLAFVYRNYARDFHSIYSNAFGESSVSENEKGLYSGIIIRPSGKWELDAYADFFRKPWLSYLVNAPSAGSEFLLQLNYRPSKALAMYVRWRDKRKQTNSSQNDEPMDFLVNTKNQNVRFNLSFKASSFLTLNSRAEWVFYHQENQPAAHGYLAYQDVKYKLSGIPLSLDIRFMLFDAESYDARLYAYENDVLYAYSVPVFSNRGMRWYLLTRYTLARGIDVWLRFAQTYYSGIDVISSGLDQINNNTKSEVKAEVRFRF
ncbi:MAG: hypothetical protein ABIQ74_12810 [Chitinophagales bacterium]